MITKIHSFTHETFFWWGGGGGGGSLFMVHYGLHMPGIIIHSVIRSSCSPSFTGFRSLIL